MVAPTRMFSCDRGYFFVAVSCQGRLARSEVDGIQTMKSFRPRVESRVALEGLEDRRLLAGGSEVFKLAAVRAKASVEVEISQVAHPSRAAPGEDQPALGLSGDSATASGLSALESAASIANSASEAEASGSAAAASSDISPSDSAVTGRSASAGDFGSPAATSVSRSQPAAMSTPSPSTGSPLANTIGQRASDDEAASPSGQASAPDDAPGGALTGAPVFSDGELPSEDATAPNVSATSLSASVSTPANASLRPAEEEQILLPASSAASASGSLDGGHGTPAQTNALAADVPRIRLRLRPGGRAEAPALSLEPEPAPEQLPGPRHAGLVGEFLPLDQVAIALRGRPIPRPVQWYRSRARSVRRVFERADHNERRGIRRAGFRRRRPPASPLSARPERQGPKRR